MKRKLLFVLLGLFVLSVLYGVREYFRTHKNLQNEKPVATLQAMQLVQAFEKDSAQSNRLYVNNVIAISGTIKSISNDDHPVIISLGEDSLLSSVQCSMDSSHAAEVKKAAIGRHITIKGLCLGAISQELFGTDVKLSRCVIVPQP